MWPDIVTQIFNWITILFYSTLWICVTFNKRFIMVIAKMKEDSEEMVQSSEKIEIMKIMNGDVKDSIEKKVSIFLFCVTKRPNLLIYIITGYLQIY